MITYKAAAMMTAAMLTCGSMIYADDLKDAKQDVKEAAKTLRNFASAPERQIPPSVMKHAKGFAIFNVVDVGLLASGKGGDGVVVARTEKGWSGPMFSGLGGAGLGGQIGAKVRNVVLVLNSDKAIKAFSHGNVKLGANLSTTAGPASASAEAQTTFTNSDIFSYAEAEGVFAGASVQGAVIAPRDGQNKVFYGKKVTPSEILSGTAAPPEAAAPLTKVLEQKATTSTPASASIR